MKIPKKLSKKITSIALCTILLSGECLATFTNVSHAATSFTDYNERNILWKIPIRLQVRHKYTFLTNTMTLHLIATRDRKLHFKYNGNLKSSFNYVLADDYRVGFRDFDHYKNTGEIKEWNFKITNKHGGQTSIVSIVQDFIYEFSRSNIKMDDIMYIHGDKWNDTVTFGNSPYLKKESSKDYSEGYKSRGLDRWKYGFQLRESGLYECPYVHSK